jgi:limonene 1,2-monooxygenase
MQLVHNWANWENTKQSYELFARYVIPKFQGLNIGREASMEWARANHDDFIGRARSAVNTRIARHIEEKGTANIAPEILKNYTGA